MAADEKITEYLRRRAASVDEEIRKALMDRSSGRHLEALLGRSGYSYDRKAIEKAVLEPSRYLFGLGGKRIRSVLMLTVIDALGKNSEDYIEFSLIPEIVHHGTLLHDDIEDNSPVRRGSEAVHVKYGVDIALNLGDFMFYFPMMALIDSKKLDRNTKSKVLEIYQREMLRLSIGQATDIAWHRAMVTPEEVTESQYLEMAYLKTGVLTGMASRIGAAIAGADDKAIEALGRLGATLGVAFQLQDDILNVTESALSSGKGGKGEDITEGKITLLAIRTFEKASPKDRGRLKEILKMHTSEPKVIDEATAIIKKYGAEAYVQGLQKRLMGEAWAEVGKIKLEQGPKRILEEIADFLISRSI